MIKRLRAIIPGFSFILLMIFQSGWPCKAMAGTAADTVSLTMPNIWAMPGDTVSIPLSISRVSHEDDIYALEGAFTYDASILTALDASKIRSITESRWSPNPTTNVKGDSLFLAFAGEYTIQGSGALLTLIFAVNPSASMGQTSALHFHRFMINEGTPFVVTRDAVFTVGEQPSVDLSADMYDFGTVEIGDSLMWSFSITNKGTASLIVLDIYSESQAFQVSSLSFPLVLSSGSSQTIGITFKPTSVDSESVSLRITSNDPRQPIAIVALSGRHMTAVEHRDETSPLPSDYGLSQNYPNPFNPTTTLSYTIPVQSIKSKVESGEGTLNLGPSTSYVTLRIYNVLGQEVATLVNGLRQPGTYSVVWDAVNNFDGSIPGGIYFYRLQAGDFSATRRMVYMR